MQPGALGGEQGHPAEDDGEPAGDDMRRQQEGAHESLQEIDVDRLQLVPTGVPQASHRLRILDAPPSVIPAGGRLRDFETIADGGDAGVGWRARVGPGDPVWNKTGWISA